MKRRTFLKLGGMSAASALLAGCQSKNEKLIPYLIPPDEGITPGRAQYYASACRSCPAGCGILVRISEGRAKKIEGNPSHPVNRGRLCAMGQALVQELYHPDRVRQPLRRSGPRGTDAFTPISWDEALKLLTTQLKALLQGGGNGRLALITPPLSGTLSELTSSFMKGFGSPHHLAFELLTADWLKTATQSNYGSAALPFYDLNETRYVISFGADFLEHHLSPVQYGNAFGQMRQGRDTVRGHFTYVGGRLSLTAASADRWLPAVPGSEGILALGMARLILSESLHDGAVLAAHGLAAPQLLKELSPYDLTTVAQQTGLAPEAIAEVARDFAATRPALAMVGESVAYQSNGAASARAVQLLNVLAGSLNRPGGIYPVAVAPEGKSDSYAELAALVQRMQAQEIQVALVHGNPVHALPSATGFQNALAKVPFVVSFASILDDTTFQADLVLPDHATLESWGDVVPRGGAREAVLGLMQPVVEPLWDTRQFADVLLAAASQLGGSVAAALPYESYQALLKDALRKGTGGAAGDAFEPAWNELLRQGVLLQKGTRQPASYRWTGGTSLPRPTAARFTGDEKQFPLHLVVYPSIAFQDGRGAAHPWLQQLPDPMTTVVWDSWVEINPTTASRLGIEFGDLVEVASPQGALRLPAVIYPGIRPDLVAIPLGQGHRAMGRYAKGRGVNGLTLLAADQEKGEPQPAWHGTRVRVTRVSAEGNLVAVGHPQGSYRSELIEI